MWATRWHGAAKSVISSKRKNSHRLPGMIHLVSSFFCFHSYADDVPYSGWHKIKTSSVHMWPINNPSSQYADMWAAAAPEENLHNRHLAGLPYAVSKLRVRPQIGPSSSSKVSLKVKADLLISIHIFTASFSVYSALWVGECSSQIKF